MKEPLVTIIIPTYNRAHFITETLNSIISQSYTNWECLVIDDGSTDNTEDILKKEYSKNTRIHYYKKPDTRSKGGNAARNFGFEISKGEFIHWFDSDDLMHKNNLFFKVNYLINNKDCDYCICNIKQFNIRYDKDELIKNEKNLKITESIYQDYILGKISILNVAPLWRKKALMNCGLYDEYIYQLQDLDFISRIIFQNRNFGFIDKYLIYVRRGNESITTRKNKIQINITSFLEVYRRIINRTPLNKEIVLHSLKQVLWAMRWKMAERNYKDAQICLDFCFTYFNRISLDRKMKLLSVLLFFQAFKTFQKGDTRFKNLLKI